MKLTKEDFEASINGMLSGFDDRKRQSPEYLDFKAMLEKDGIKPALEWLGIKHHELASAMLLVLKDAGYKTTEATMPALLNVYMEQKEARRVLGHQVDVRFMARDIMHKKVIDTFA